jgi:hypothetical protein
VRLEDDGAVRAPISQDHRASGLEFCGRLLAGARTRLVPVRYARRPQEDDSDCGVTGCQAAQHPSTTLRSGPPSASIVKTDSCPSTRRVKRTLFPSGDHEGSLSFDWVVVARTSWVIREPSTSIT